jgi:small subunit ribosomal protein S9
MNPKISTTKPAKKTIVKKTSGVKSHTVGRPKKIANKPAVAEESKVLEHKAKPAVEHEAKERYIFATGRRKTAIANVRLFHGKGESLINKKPVKSYFGYQYHLEELDKPFDLTGLKNDYHFIAHINGGGIHSQAEALRHGLSTALTKAVPETRKILKKNGFLTRDDRKKERKKPGLKRARRSPQWAKR